MIEAWDERVEGNNYRKTTPNPILRLVQVEIGASIESGSKKS